jgi:hypothetical protein
MKTSGSAVRHGGMKDGKGAISTKSGAMDSYPYGFASRFEGKPGTNPEELIGAAHAGCFTMALSMILRRLQSGRDDDLSRGHAGPGCRQFRHHRRAPDARRTCARHRSSEVRTARLGGKSRLPGLQAVEGADHAGRDAAFLKRG